MNINFHKFSAWPGIRVKFRLLCKHFPMLKMFSFKWITLFKNGPSKICGRQPLKNFRDIVCLSRPYHFKFFKGCLPQILLGPFLNTLTELSLLILLRLTHFIPLVSFHTPCKTIDNSATKWVKKNRGYLGWFGRQCTDFGYMEFRCSK